MVLHEIKKFLHIKETITRIKRQPTEWKEVFTSYSMDKGLISRIRRELRKLHSKRTNNPINKWANKLNTVLRSKNG
jgi:hypothetical protein